MFTAARPKFETAARLALAHPGTAPVAVDAGLYGRCQVEVVGPTAYIWILAGGSLDRDGFAYSPGDPPSNYCHCEPIEGPWYRCHLKS
jgi:hypothetical protein